ncbi:MAG: TIGR03643 family protein [Pseudomonadota bacterium]
MKQPQKQAQNHSEKDNFSEADIARIIEMAWEDRTAFEAIEVQFGLNQDGVIKLMRSQLKLNSFKLWRKRTRGQITKHLKLRSDDIVRHQSKQHNKLYR